jgi:predicted transcriptional regulator
MAYSEGKIKSHNFSLRLPESTREDLQKIADREEVSPAFLIRKAIETFLDQDKKEQNNV